MSDKEAEFYTEEQLKKYELSKCFSELYSEIQTRMDSLTLQYATIKEHIAKAHEDYTKYQRQLEADMDEYNNYFKTEQNNLNVLPDFIQDLFKDKYNAADLIISDEKALEILNKISDQCVQDADIVKTISNEKALAKQAAKNIRNKELLKENEFYDEYDKENKNKIYLYKTEKNLEIDRLKKITEFNRDQGLEKQFQACINEYNSPAFYELGAKIKGLGFIKGTDSSPSNDWIFNPGTMEEIKLRLQSICSCISDIKDYDTAILDEIRSLRAEYSSLMANSRELKKLEPDPSKRSDDITKLVEITYVKLSQIDGKIAELEKQHSQNQIDLKFLELSRKIAEDLINQKFITLNKQKAQEDLDKLLSESEDDSKYSTENITQKYDQRLSEIQDKEKESERQIDEKYNQKLLPYKMSFEKLLRIKRLIEKIIISRNAVLEKAALLESLSSEYKSKITEIIKELEQAKTSASIKIGRLELQAESADDTESVIKIKDLKDKLEKDYEAKIAAII